MHLYIHNSCDFTPMHVSDSIRLHLFWQLIHPLQVS